MLVFEDIPAIEGEKPKTKKPRRLKPGEIYFPDQDSFLPGRPLWITLYATLLAIVGIVTIVGLGLRTIGGTLLETYGSYVPVVGIAIISCVGIFAGVELWQLKSRGRLLTMGLQIVWMVGVPILFIIAYSGLFTTTHRSLFIQGTVKGVGYHLLFTLVILVFLYLLTLSFFPMRGAPRASALESEMNQRTFILMYGIFGVLILSVTTIAALLAFFLEPSLLVATASQLQDLSSFVKGGLILSVPVNAVVLFGLVKEQ
jgi:hypothetical protein